MAQQMAVRSNDAAETGRLVVERTAAERRLVGEEKAAALLLALGPEITRPVFKQLDDSEIRQLSHAMVRIGSITQRMLDELLVDFVSRVTSSGSLSGNPESTERLLQSVMPPERAAQILEELRGPAGRNIWEKLSNVQEDVLANFLKNEYPRTASVVLSRLSTDHASRVLANMPDVLAMDVVLRMLAIEPVQKDILEKIEGTLRAEFMSTLSQTRRRDSHEQILDRTNRANALIQQFSVLPPELQVSTRRGFTEALRELKWPDAENALDAEPAPQEPGLTAPQSFI